MEDFFRERVQSILAFSTNGHFAVILTALIVSLGGWLVSHHVINLKRSDQEKFCSELYWVLLSIDKCNDNHN